LTAESNPENGNVYYTFDTSPTCGVSSAGDLILRTDVAGNLTCYAHDALHRVTHIWYSGSSMNDKYFVYDAATGDGVAMQNVKGRLAEAHNGTTDLGFSYPNPATGQMDLFQLSPNSGGWYTTISTAYPNGALASLALPSGPAVAYGLDGEGRPAMASGNGTPLVTGTSYSALGPLGISFANLDSDSFAYDATTGRMMQYQLTVGGQTDKGVYTWNANGSQASLAITDTITGTADTQTCTYPHDDMGRLASSSCGGLWGQTYAFDPFGNMNKGASAGSTPFNATYNLKNQIAGVGGSFVPNYDPNGGLVDDPVAGTRNANAFDLEGKPTMIEGHAGIVSDALGRVVESGGQEFVYGPGGGKLAVMSGQTLVRADIPLPGGAGAVFNASGLVYYQHSDLLGSARLASTPGRTLYSSSAYAPFGENYAATGSVNKVFTGQHQDIDSTTSGGQYDFLMREYSAAQSRWWTPDPAGLDAVDPEDPATWNRYSYVTGQPLGETDPDGCAGLKCPDGSHRATPTDAKAYMKVAESYLNHQVSHPPKGTGHYGTGPTQIDCSGLLMCAFSGTSYSNPIRQVQRYIGMDLRTKDIDDWTVPGTGAYGDVIYFKKPGHVGLVEGPSSFIGSQSSTGVATVPFGPEARYWGNPSARDPSGEPVFRRPCIANPHVPAPASALGGGGEAFADPLGKSWFWLMEYINAWWTPAVQPPGEVMQVGGNT
jgi:RHS repeat-associated protein